MAKSGEPVYLGYIAVKKELRLDAYQLSETEQDQLEAAISQLYVFHQRQSIFAILLRNFKSYQSILRDHARELAYGASLHPGGSEHSLDRILIDVQQGLMNFLSSMRTFLDHAETYLKRTYGPQSAEYVSFQKETNRQYDENFAYRFIYRLRNYVQHCGMPIGNIRLNQSADIQQQTMESSIMLSFNRTALLSTKSVWGSQVRDELHQLSEEVPVNPHVFAVMECLNQVHLALLSIELPPAREHANVVLALCKKAGITPDQTPILSTGQSVQRCSDLEGAYRVRTEGIPMWIIEDVRKLNDMVEHA